MGIFPSPQMAPETPLSTWRLRPRLWFAGVPAALWRWEILGTGEPGKKSRQSATLHRKRWRHVPFGAGNRVQHRLCRLKIISIFRTYVRRTDVSVPQQAA